ncbi:MAG: hypothetical protein COB02_09230 [Candidatus Cloacimonadota bacterium]|nr:MAG: hypothetical protein COB02_09230 [Candidatus Cloacimonadota bacterium]
MNIKTAVLAFSLQLGSSLQAVELSFFNYEKYNNLSNRLFETYSIDSDKSSVLKRNTSYYFKNYLRIDDVNIAISAEKDKFLESIYQRNFWADKLERDISIPYSDKEVFSYFVTLQKEINHFLKYLEVANEENSTFKLYLYGSMAKGRFGANSSVDLRVESNDLGFLKTIEEGVYSKNHRDFRGNIEASTPLLSSKDILDPLVEVSIESFSNLKKVYTKILDKMGFQLDVIDDSLKITVSGKRQRIHMEFNPVEDRVFYLDKKAIKLRKSILSSFNLLRGDEATDSTFSKSSFLKRLKRLITDYEEVRKDLLIITENKSNDRYKIIQSVISKTSFDRLKRGLANKLLLHVTDKLNKLNKVNSIL